MKTARILALTALAAVVLTGCRRQQPPTEVPPSPLIERFSASATDVPSGSAVTLSWKVVNATGIELREATSGTLNVPFNQFEGELVVNPTETSLYVLTVRGETGTDARAVAVTVPPGQGAVSFQALPPIVAGGDVSTLVWLAPGASTVTLNAGATAVETGGQVSSGAVTVRPLADTTYTLTVDGTPYTASVEVQPATLSFTATPGAVEVGGTISLAWTSAGATRVQLSGANRGVLFESTDAAQVQQGGFNDTAPSLPSNGVLAYELLVEKGSQRMTRTLEVFVGTGLAIVRLDAPPVAARGGNYILRWQTLTADEVELRVNGALTFSTANPTQALNGSASFPTPNEDFGLELIAINHRGSRVTRSTQVEVVGVPTGITLDATPATVSAGGAVTLTWASAESRRLRITDADGQAVFSVQGQMAEGGSTTVYPPHAGTTYRVVADNLLGSAPVSATAAVTVTGTPLELLTPAVAINGSTFEARANDPTALLVGFPHTQVLTSSRADFIDIKTTGAQLDVSSGITHVDTGFTTFMWGLKQPTTLAVCRAGWMAFGPALASVTSDVALPSASAPNNIIAPFWDNLTLTANSGVFWQVIGQAPNERLIVQWDRMQVGTDTDTELTFQVHVHQNGSLAFQYQTVNLTLPYTAFEIGLQDEFTKRAVRTDITPESDTALYFFSPVAAAAQVPAVRRTRFGGFLQKDGVSALFSRPSPAISMPEDLAVTEVLLNPNPAVPNGQYAEFLNRTMSPIDLTGWYVTSPVGGRFDFPAGFTLQPDVNVVIGASVDPVENDDAGVTLSWGGFSLPRDGGAVFIGANDAGFSLTFARSNAGVATVVDPGTFRVGTASTARFLVCDAPTGFGGQTPQQQGHPGVHGGCGFGYRSRPITPHFVDITDGGTALGNSPGIAIDDLTTPITLAASPTDPQPVIFGVPTPVVSMSIDGWIAPFSTTVVNSNNRTTPGATTAPRGAIAPFWDDLQTTLGRTPESDMYWKRMAAGEDPLRPEPHWIFQWHRVRHYNTSPADDLSFEVKIFEDGVIEYHYADMLSGTSTTYGDGNSATVWIDHRDGGTALIESVNTADVRPFSAVRFIPQ